MFGRIPVVQVFEKLVQDDHRASPGPCSWMSWKWDVCPPLPRALCPPNPFIEFAIAVLPTIMQHRIFIQTTATHSKIRYLTSDF